MSARRLPAVRALLFCGIIALLNFDPAAAQAPSTLPAPWNAQDIGNPAIAGSASFDQGQFTITAAGTDIWGQTDQFTFVYQQVTGDVDVIARVDSVTAAHAWSKAGVMIRASLAADSAHGFALVSAGKGVAFQRRQQDGGLSTNTYGPILAPPRWVRLVRLGTNLTAYTSADGSAWSVIDSSVIALGAPAYVGLAVTSHNEVAATTALASQVSVVRLSLPAGQQARDIGAPAMSGSVAYRDGVYTVRAGGADIWGTADQFHFVYQPIQGDVDIRARVRSISYAARWSKSGVMIRETLDADSPHAFALGSAGAGYAFQRRIEAGGFSQSTAGSADVPPGWVRLVRSGARIEAFQSVDGTAWTSIGSDSIPMADAVYVGIATTSHNTTASTDAVVDNLSITPIGSSTNQPPQATITGPVDGSTFAAGSDIVVNAAASDTDGTISRVEFFAGSTPIGSVATAPYSVTWAAVPAGTYSLTAVAVDNDGATATSAAVGIRVDPGANQPPTVSLTAPANGATYTAPATVSLTASATDPDGTIARVEFYNGGALLNTDATAPYAFTWSSVPPGSYAIRAIAYDNSAASATSVTATITVTAANQPPAVTLTAPANGATYTAPATVSLTASATDPDGTIARVEFYNGTTLLDSDTVAPYACTWSAVPAGTYAIRAIAYDNGGASVTSSNATITVAASGLPAGQQDADIGAPALSGSATYSGGSYTITAGGAGIWGTADQFHFVYEPASGDLDLRLHVASVSAADSYSSAGVMIRESLAPGSKHAFMLLSAGRGYSFNQRMQTDGITDGLAGPGPAPGWVRLTRVGSLFTAYRSSDGMTWTQLNSVTVTMGSAVYAGIALTANTPTATTTAVVDTFSVTQGTPANQAPTVTLTAPANGATYAAPATVSLSASATDPDGTIARVEFYNGTTLLNSDTVAPYAFTWSSVAAGTYTVRAVAYDNGGASATSATSTITVSTTTSPPPTGIVFQASVDHATLVARYELRIFASGADPATAIPIATSDLGKPDPDVNGDITVDRAAFFDGLSQGSYVAAVAAIGAGGSSSSSGVAFTR